MFEIGGRQNERRIYFECRAEARISAITFVIEPKWRSGPGRIGADWAKMPQLDCKLHSK